MWISRIKLTNVRGFFDVHEFDVSKGINLFVGQNNAGKSTILNALLSLQIHSLSGLDISLDKEQGQILLTSNDTAAFTNGREFHQMFCNLIPGNVLVWNCSGHDGGMNFSYLPQSEPNNLIYPYLSKRKVTQFSEEVRQEISNAVSGNLANLYAKVDRLSNPFFQPGHDEYRRACEEVLGFIVSTVNSASGKTAAYIIRNLVNIPLLSMGEGVSNLLGMIVDLCIAENRIFIIEEPENDVHPKALKSLLNLIEKKAATNQFFISTHSNIVTKYLGSLSNSKVFRVSMSFDQNTRFPISSVEEVENEPTARMRLLEELGYEPFDFGQWKSWLILEESSAEEIIRDFLVPNFVPKLKNNLRTYSAKSLDEVEPKFKDFNNLFVFIHLEQIYKNKAWVVVDAGDREAEIIVKLRETYSASGWDESNFRQFSEHDFERYYPTRFAERVEQVLALTDKKLKWQRKQNLLREVKEWINENPEDAKIEFAESAKDVIEILKTIKKATD